jgi:hypothetical protein
MKKQQKNSDRASALQITLSVALISVSAILLAIAAPTNSKKASRQVTVADQPMMTFTVTNTSDGGSGSLRQAINDANGNAGLDTIAFNIPGSGVHTITPAFPQLPSITSPVVIDGSTQPGFAGLPLIEISGATIGNNGNGLVIDAGGSGSTIRSLVINHGWSLGILLANNCVIEGCFLGTDPTGTIAFGNTQGIGTNFAASVTNNVIGGTTAAARNLISGNAIGVLLNNGATNNLIEGNFIGTDITGGNALGNGTGVDLRDGNNVVGGTTAAARNVIGANNTGISVSTSTGNHIQGNFIGTDVTGTIALGLGDGIYIVAAAQIGGLTATPGTPPGNVISGNRGGGGSGHGIVVSNGISNNVIQGNLIGTDATGTQPLGNGLDGVEIFGAANVIGGTDVMARNVISGNGRNGILMGTDNAPVHDNLIQGNFIGTDITGTNVLGNAGDGVRVLVSTNNTIGGVSTPGEVPGNLIAGNAGRGVGVSFGVTGLAIEGNSISLNGGLGLDLNLDAVTPNDPCDTDTGPNNLQNYPVITSASFGSGFVMLSGTLDSVPNTMFRLEFFSNTEGDPSGFGEGQTFLGSTTVTTDGSCSASFGPLSFPVPPGQLLVSATATRLDTGGNPIETSEFSAFYPGPPPPMPTGAASRKVHGSAGTFDIDLPLTGNVGIECRSGGATNDYEMIITFANSVTVESASVTSGTGSVSSFSVSGSQVTVNLTGVTNVQRITVTLHNVNDGMHSGDVSLSMGVLVGDVNGNAIVNASDVSLTKSQVGNPVSGSNFREDVNANGLINSVDVALVKSKVGTALPP